MNDSYFTQANNYAKAQANQYRSTFDSTLNDLLTMSQKSREQATNNYNNLLNQIDANRVNLREQYKTNARQAYINKLLADQQTTDTLSRMNLNQSGFRLTQDTLTNNRYDASLNSLAMARDEGLRDLANQGLDALNDYNNNLLKLDLDYAAKYNEAKDNIDDKVRAYESDVYNKMYNDLKYQDQLKQQAFENQLAKEKNDAYIRNLNASTKVTLGGGSGSGSGSGNFGSGNGSGSGSKTTIPKAGSKNNPYLKYNWEQTSHAMSLVENPNNALSLNGSLVLGRILRQYGTRDKDGYYDVKNTSVAQYDLLNALGQAQAEGEITDTDIDHILKIFGYEDKIKKYPNPNDDTSNGSGGGGGFSAAGGGTGSSGGSGSGGGGFRGINLQTPSFDSTKNNKSASVTKWQNILDNFNKR